MNGEWKKIFTKKCYKCAIFHEIMIQVYKRAKVQVPLHTTSLHSWMLCTNDTHEYISYTCPPNPTENLLLQRVNLYTLSNKPVARNISKLLRTKICKWDIAFSSTRGYVFLDRKHWTYGMKNWAGVGVWGVILKWV